MPKFIYTAVNIAGEQIQGEYTMPNSQGVVSLLRQRDFYPVTIEEKKEAAPLFSQQVKIKQLAAYCTQFAAMLKSGVPIARTLEILQEQTEYVPLKKITASVMQDVRTGSSLTDALSNHSHRFPVMFLSMVEAGEQSGNLDQCMERAGTSFARTAKLSARVKNALIYPSVILVVLIGLTIFLLTFIVPQFGEMFEQQGVDLPAFTQFLIDTGDFMVYFWYVLVGIFVAIILGFKLVFSFNGPKTAWHKKLLRLPVVGKLITKVYAAQFTRTLASLTSAGVSLTGALAVTARSVVNKYIEQQTYKIAEGINRGEMLSTQLQAANVFPPLIIHSANIGEESGTLDDMLLKTADFYDDEADLAIQALMAALEPALIVLLAFIVAPILIGVLLPMFGMFDIMMAP